MQDYSKAIHIAGGNPNVVVKYLPLMLTGTSQQWIDDLPEKSICNWLDMHEAFTMNFEGMYKRPCTVGDLQWCVQEKDETSHAYQSRRLDMKNSCAGVHEQTAMAAFVDGLEKGTLLRHKLKHKKFHPFLAHTAGGLRHYMDVCTCPRNSW